MVVNDHFDANSDTALKPSVNDYFYQPRYTVMVSVGDY